MNVYGMYDLNQHFLVILTHFCKQQPKNNPQGYCQGQGEVSHVKECLHSSSKICAVFPSPQCFLAPEAHWA